MPTGEPRVSAVVHQTIAGPMGRGVKADIEITAYEPNTLYAFRAVEGPVRPVGSYAFAEVGGGTEVTFSLSAEVSGLKKVLMSGPVQKSMDGEMAALDTAKVCLSDCLTRHAPCHHWRVDHPQCDRPRPSALLQARRRGEGGLQIEFPAALLGIRHRIPERLP